jgi:hypothetical protein
MAIMTCLYERHKGRQESERGWLVVASLNEWSEIDVFQDGRSLLYVHGITGGSGMQQAFGYFEG